VTDLELDAARLAAFEEEEEEPETPLHVRVSWFLDKVALLWVRRRFLMGWTFGAMVVTLLLMLLVPNRYRAAAYLNPPDMNPMSGISLLIGMKGGIPSGLGSSMGDMLGLKSPGQIYIRQMQSRPVKDALIQRFHLQQAYKTKTIEKTRKALEENSSFNEEKKSGVIEIGVMDRDPNRAAQMANAYAEELGKLVASLNAESGRLEREYFESQLLLAKNDFRQASEELGKYGGQHGALGIDEEGKALGETVAVIQGQLIAARSELRGLQQIYTDSNVLVQQANARVAELTRQLAQVSSGNRPQNQGSAKAKTESHPAGPSIRRMWGLAPSYMNLYGDMKIKEAIVQTLAEQYEISKLQENRRVTEIQVLDPAQPPEKKATPHRALTTLIVGFLVFGILSVWIVAKDRWARLGADNPWKQILQPATHISQS
jgi:capsule polysaccharide export protein KpsE/RkpR